MSIRVDTLTNCTRIIITAIGHNFHFDRSTTGVDGDHRAVAHVIREEIERIERGGDNRFHERINLIGKLVRQNAALRGTITRMKRAMVKP